MRKSDIVDKYESASLTQIFQETAILNIKQIKSLSNAKPKKK